MAIRTKLPRKPKATKKTAKRESTDLAQVKRAADPRLSSFDNEARR
jgi:hypothetical protein